VIPKALPDIHCWSKQGLTDRCPASAVEGFTAVSRHVVFDMKARVVVTAIPNLMSKCTVASSRTLMVRHWKNRPVWLVLHGMMVLLAIQQLIRQLDQGLPKSCGMIINGIIMG
jgi:hypothetical protein